MESKVFDQLVGQLYDVALVPEKLPETLAALTRWLAGDTCHLVGWDGKSGAPMLSATIGFDEGIGPDYAAHYAAIDPRQLIAEQKLSTGELLLCHEHFDSRFVSRSEFFQDYLLPIGVHYTLASTLIRNERHVVQIAFQRYIGHKAFSSSEADCLRRLMPHLQHAISLMLRTNDLSQQAEFAARGLATTSLALISLDSSGLVHYCNALGEALLRDGDVLQLRNGQISLGIGTRKSGADDLIKAIRVVVQTQRPASLLLRNAKHADQRYSVTLMPAPKTDNPVLISMAAMEKGVLCMVAPLDRRRIATARQLMELFGLTPAEGRLARALAGSETLEDYAREAGLRMPTAKSQLRSIFIKMSCDRQAELVRIVLAVPAVRDPIEFVRNPA